MLPKVIQAPQPLVTLEDFKRYMLIEHSEADEKIDDLLASASAEMDGPGSIGRAVGEQVLEIALDRFPCGGIAIPVPRFIEVIGVQWTSITGDAMELAPTDCRFVTARRYDGEIVPVSAWPTDVEPGSVRLQYKAGYASSEPEFLIARQAVRMLAKHWYDDPEATVRIPAGVELLRNRIRVKRFG